MVGGDLDFCVGSSIVQDTNGISTSHALSLSPSGSPQATHFQCHLLDLHKPRTLTVTFWISTSHALLLSLFVSPPIQQHQPSQKTGISITNHKTVQCLHRHVHHYGLYIPGSTLRSLTLTTPLPGGISRISTTIDITIQRHRSDLRHKRYNHQFSQMGSPPLQEPPSSVTTA